MNCTNLTKQNDSNSKVAQIFKDDNNLELMLITQMLSVHDLQQEAMRVSKVNLDNPKAQYLINASIKLSNTFTQQAALLSKLQGKGSQKIIVEHVDVHDGGQAIVGDVSGK
jgi:hypothetical protein